MRSFARTSSLPLLVVAVAVVGWIAVMATGHRTLVVMSGSMAPALWAGDVALVRSIPPEAADVGDIVTFRDPSRERKLVTHRAVYIERSGDMFAFATKGDQNSGIEEWTVPADGRIGRLTLRVPIVGQILLWLGDPNVRAVMVAGAFLLLGGVAIQYALRMGGGVTQRVPLLVVAAGLAVLLGTAMVPGTLAALSSQTSNPANNFQAAASFCTAGAVTVYAAADAYVQESTPTSNYGSGTTLFAKAGNPHTRRSFVRFDLPALGACKLSTATLQLYTQSATTPNTIEAARVTGPWTEPAITWANQPGWTTPATTAAGPGWISWSVTSQTAAMYAGANHGFVLKDASETARPDEQAWASRETAFTPALTITYGP